MRFNPPEISTFPCTRFPIPIGIVIFAAVLSGCGDEPSPEQRHADTVLSNAKAELGRLDYRRAKEDLLSALTLDEGLNRKPKVAEEAQLLGDIAAAAASDDTALIWYARCLEEYKALADRNGVREITLRVASLRRRMGDERKAFSMYVEMLRLARVFHDEDGVREIQWAMLPCARALDEGEEETGILHELLQGASSTGDVALQGAIFLESGNDKFAVGAFDRAAEDFLRSLLLADQARDSLLAARATLRLAMTFEGAGRLRDALTSYGDCLKRADRTHGAAGIRLEALIRVGNVYLRSRHFEEAVKFFKAALSAARAMGNMVAEGYLYLQLGHCDVESSRESAHRSYRSGIDIFKSLAYAAGEAYGCLCLGNLFRRNNQPVDALQYFKSAIEYSESAAAPRSPDDLYLSCEQAYLGARRTPWYDEAIDILLQLGRYDEAFWYVDRRNGRDLHDVLGELDAQPEDDSLRVLFAAYRAARDHRVAAERVCRELAATGKAKNELFTSAVVEQDRGVAQMNEAAAAIARRNRSMEPFVRLASLSLTEVQRALPPGSALVQHVLARRALYAFVITNAKSGVFVAAFEKDRAFDLSKEFVELLRIRALYVDSTNEQQAAIDQRLQELNGPLYEAFVGPIEQALTGVPEILVVPPREAYALPLHALSKGTVRRGGYFGEQHSVHYIPSASALLLPQRTQSSVKEVVALGCAGGTSWDVEYELRDIRAFYKDARLYFDQQATLATLQTEKSDVLHLAVRIRFNDQRPGNSFLVLSDGKSAETMKRVPLGDLLSIEPAPTVLVSDLDEQRTGIRPAEAYLFLSNGTQQAILTSITPSRKAKKFFGEIFYTTLLTGAAPRVAYQSAVLEMIRNRDFTSPHNWAPFFLWGR